MRFIIGVDEAGRGCMWGSVFAGAVILPERLMDEDKLSTTEKFMLRDSKKLSEKRRNEAAIFIKENAISWGVGEATASEIDKYNILQATHMSMHRAIDSCYKKVVNMFPNTDDIEFEIKIDGNSFRLYQDPINGDVIPHECIIGGDASERCIAAASILAKTSRDAFVKQKTEEDPDLNYKWDMGKHKGYCTKSHLNALQEHGVHHLHRKSYSPVKRVLLNRTSLG